MLITIVYIGSPNNSLRDISKEYEKRINQIGKSIGLKKISYKSIKHSNKKNVIEKKKRKQINCGEIKGQTLNILLDRAGTKLDSFEFSKLIFTQTGNNENIKFFIGGSEGIDQNYFNDFDKIISFGDLTWPHKMFKMMLLEQIYRSITIINKHPYHK